LNPAAAGTISQTEEATPSQDASSDKQQHRIVEELTDVGRKAILGAAEAASKRAASRKLGVADALPGPGLMFDPTGRPERIIMLQSMWDSPYQLSELIVVLAAELNLPLTLSPATSAHREYLEDDFLAGAIIGVRDRGALINTSGTDKKYELGRKFVRSQQIIKLFQHEYLSEALLRRDHLYFANNPGEQKMVGKTMQPVIPLQKVLAAYIREDAYTEQIRKMVITLIRMTACNLTHQAREHAIKSNMLSFDTYIKRHIGREVLLEQKGRGQKPIKVLRSATMPSLSPVLTRGEYTLLKERAKALFVDSPIRSMDAWYTAIQTHGIRRIHGDLQSTHKLRMKFIITFAQFTTRRLRNIREYVPGADKKRKRDVDPNDLTLYCKKIDYKSEFANFWSSTAPGPEYMFVAECSGTKSEKSAIIARFSELIKDEVTEIQEISASDLAALFAAESERAVRDAATQMADLGLCFADLTEQALSSLKRCRAAYELLDKPNLTMGVPADAYLHLPSRVKKANEEYLKSGDKNKFFSTVITIESAVADLIAKKDILSRLKDVHTRASRSVKRAGAAPQKGAASASRNPIPKRK
jgi:hypothetical protein